MSEVSFHLPMAGYETLVRIIAGYLHAGANVEPVSVSSVADLIAMKGPNISSNNKFFVSTEILERAGKGYRLTSEGARLARVLDYCSEDAEDTAAPEVQSAWEMIVEKHDFLQRVTTAVRVRGNMETEAFARHIALTSGVPNKPRYMTGARTIITILKKANRLTEDEDCTLRAVDAKPRVQDITVEPPTPVERQTVIPLLQQAKLTALGSGIPLTVMIQITPATTDDELAELARKIKQLTRLIHTGDEVRDDNSEIS